MKFPALIALTLLAFFSTTFSARAGLASVRVDRSTARADLAAARAESDGAINLSIDTSGSSTLTNSVAATTEKQTTSATDADTSFVPARSTALTFDLPNTGTVATAPAPSVLVVPAAPSPSASASLFKGGSDSLVARTVGHAEGTRASDGTKTHAYYGHVDPGNGVWNMGSFSYQHEAKSPEEADEKQLQRLQAQADVIRQRADTQRLNLSLEEELNAIDLANQAPLAALDTPGYVDWLKKAHDRGLTGSDAVLWARTQSYWNPRLNRWEAPGLGNTEANISHDQNRRQTAIARALSIYEQQQMARRKEEEPQEKVADKPLPEKVAATTIAPGLSPSSDGSIAQAGN